ncbi:hypothetical protein [Nocardioides conyzicola]|uniref:Uncharacterized protein n=1 Tax=Nocardioides conyzicola TaxID=1651781 RepID=A0ABP8X6T7_9ACTN
MASVDPTTYAWLSDSELQVAGCVTVVPDADPEAVARSFGHDPADAGEERDTSAAGFGERAALGDLGDDRNEIWVAPTAGAAVVFEFNGFEGSRTEVLREASRVGAGKVAASLYWNVNGAVQVTCARRGKVVGSVDLSYVDEEDLEEVPRALRALARLCMGDEPPDLLTVGAAMVETYAGVGFSRTDLDGSRPRAIVARPSDLSTYTPGSSGYGPLDHSLPGAQDAMDAMDPEALRSLAEWSALAAVREAGLTDEPAVQAVLAQLGSGAGTSLPPGIAELRRRATAEAERQRRLVDETFDEASVGALAQCHAWLPANALEALRYTSHADAYSAAVGALAAAASTFTCTRLDRGARVVEDHRGRRIDSLAPSPRMLEFADVVRQVLASDPARWDELAGLLPAPLSAAELAAAADVDRRRQEAGAFDTWRVAEGWLDPDDDAEDDELEVEHDHDAQVLERYRELELRDQAIADRGPIAVEVLEPENEGGFAIALSDGLRIERLPIGRAAGKLWLGFVFTHEFGFDPNARGARSDPYERITYTASDGPLQHVGGGGGQGASVAHWSAQIDTAGRTWVRLDYLDGGRSVASETIGLA